MNCPYCAREMETGYLRGEGGYELLWTSDPFKMTQLALGGDLRLCKVTDIDKPKAQLCRACGKIVLDLTDKIEF